VKAILHSLSSFEFKTINKGERSFLMQKVTKPMLAVLCAVVGCSKIEVELAVKYSSACPGSHESFIIVNNQNYPMKPAIYTSTYIRLHPGKHVILITHPWCSFPEVMLDLHEDGTFRAVSNSSWTETFPIVIRHGPNTEDDILSKLTGSPMMFLLLLVPVAMFICRSIVSSPSVQAKIQKFQQDMQQQLQEQNRRAAAH
jgi:hypothetical protein